MKVVYGGFVEKTEKRGFVLTYVSLLKVSSNVRAGV